MLISQLVDKHKNKFLLFILLFIGAPLVLTGPCLYMDQQSHRRSAGAVFGEKVDRSDFERMLKRWDGMRKLSMLPFLMRAGGRFRFTPPLKEQVDSAWERLAVLHEAREAGIHATEEEIRTWIEETWTRMFQEFDAARYRQIVERELEMTPEDFELTVGEFLEIERYLEIHLESDAPEAETVFAEYLKRYEQRSLQAVVLRPADFLAKVPEPTPDEVQKRLEADKKQYRVEARAQIEYVLADNEAMKALVPEPAGDEVKKYYDEHRDEFVTPPPEIEGPPNPAGAAPGASSAPASPASPSAPSAPPAPSALPASGTTELPKGASTGPAVPRAIGGPFPDDPELLAQAPASAVTPPPVPAPAAVPPAAPAAAAVPASPTAEIPDPYLPLEKVRGKIVDALKGEQAARLAFEHLAEFNQVVAAKQVELGKDQDKLGLEALLTGWIAEAEKKAGKKPGLRYGVTATFGASDLGEKVEKDLGALPKLRDYLFDEKAALPKFEFGPQIEITEKGCLIFRVLDRVEAKEGVATSENLAAVTKAIRDEAAMKLAAEEARKILEAAKEKGWESVVAERKLAVVDAGRVQSRDTPKALEPESSRAVERAFQIAVPGTDVVELRDRVILIRVAEAQPPDGGDYETRRKSIRDELARSGRSRRRELLTQAIREQAGVQVDPEFDKDLQQRIKTETKSGEEQP